MPFFSNACVFFTLIGFLSGSLMFSYGLPKLLKGVDVRDIAPDRNPGGANAIRAAGVGIGLLCIALDILKAFLPVYAAVACAGVRGMELVPVAAAPVFGHAFSPFLKFHGGKAVAAFYGVLLALWPLSHIVLLPAAAMILFKFLAVVKPDSLCVFISLFLSCCAMFFLEPDVTVRAAFFLAQAAVLYRTARNPNGGKASIRIGRHMFFASDLHPRLRRP